METTTQEQINAELEEKREAYASLKQVIILLIGNAKEPISGWTLFEALAPFGYRTGEIQMVCFQLMSEGKIEWDSQFMLVLVPSREETRFRSMRGH